MRQFIRLGMNVRNLGLFDFPGRGDRIRTCDPYLPKVVLYQAELHPDVYLKNPLTIQEKGWIRQSTLMVT